MFSFNKFIVTASIATIASLSTMWASASSIREPVPTLSDLHDEAAFTEAQADLMNAPAFCAVTYIRRDYTRGYVAVCELDGAE